MEKEILDLLHTLRAYALQKGLTALIEYHEEESALMRFANSAISLNTNEHLVRLDFQGYDGRKRANFSMITDPADLPAMRRGLDTLAEMLPHAQPLSYTPTLPHYAQDVSDTRACDPALAALGNAERLAFFNTAARGFESPDLQLSGLFSSGVTTWAQISTTTEHTQYFQASDAQVIVVISSDNLKWEVNAEQSAQKKADLDAEALHAELALLLAHYRSDPPVQLPLGRYTVVLGPAATAQVVEMMAQIALDGGNMRRGYSFLNEQHIGQPVLSPLFTLRDDPTALPTYPLSFDQMGLPHPLFPFFEQGIFRGFIWSQDDADEFGQQPTGHSLPHLNLVLEPGSEPVASLAELISRPRTEDLLYVPYLHYMNVVNPSEGTITGSSRFGALLLKRDGSVQVPYNVRLTQRFSDFFGENLAWLSRAQAVYNTSSSYSRRNPTALCVPRLLCVKGIEISHSNSAY